MTTYIIKNFSNNQSVTHDSDVDTWGALQDEVMETYGDDVVRPGMKAVLRSDRTRLQGDSKLPEGDQVKISLFASKLDAGL